MVKRPWLLVLAILIGACTSSATDDAATDGASVASNATSSTVAAEASATTQTTALSSDESGNVAGSSSVAQSSVAPLRPYDEEAPAPEDDGPDESVYITRAAMSDTSIEMKWSPHEDAVEHHLHRIPEPSDQRPDNGAMTEGNKILVATDSNKFVDDGVESGVRYWYGLRAFNADGAVVAHGWHRTAAVTDTAPPSPVDTLSATYENGEVLLAWTAPAENYELHAYNVLRGVNGGELESVSTTWNLDQMSFVDDDPPASGSVTYAVVAMDFHWNKSTPAPVSVDLG